MIFIPFTLHFVCAALAKTARIAVIASSGSTNLVYGLRYRTFKVQARNDIQTRFTTCVLIELVRCGRMSPDIVD